MERKSRILKELKLKDETFFFEGDLTIEGDVYLENAQLIVAGSLKLQTGRLYGIISSIIISDELLFGCTKIELDCCEVSASYIDSTYACPILNASDTDIFAATNFEYHDDIVAYDISVNGYTDLKNVLCNSYFVCSNNSRDITAVKSIYIVEDSDSCTLTGTDIFIGGEAFFNGFGFFASGSSYVPNIVG